jgi:hypothetical protein
MDVAAVRRLGAAAGVDAPALLGERVALAGCHGTGRVSCSGATRLLPAADGWLAVSLARPDDVELVPAWLGTSSVDAGIAGLPAAEAAARGRLLGLPVAVPGERAAGDLYGAVRLGDAPPLERPPVVVDLSSLWAGPLCTRILAERGARVVKVESVTRPDGARFGSPAFFDLLHAGKEFVTLQFTATELLPLLLAADVVVEGSRPRALEQLGIDAAAVVGDGPQVWLSITGHGRTGPQRDWVALGDDAAVAGGLVDWCDGEPNFVGDAVADPLTGIAGAGAVLDLLARGGRWLVDCSLAGVAAHMAA